MIHKLDNSVGTLVNKLEELRLSDDTLIIFTGDNGHEPGYYRPEEDKNEAYQCRAVA